MLAAHEIVGIAQLTQGLHTHAGHDIHVQHNVDAVSYTHLDVYKRQAPVRAAAGCAVLPDLFAERPFSAPLAAGFLFRVVCCRAHRHYPVSYTHLDVYKRQGGGGGRRAGRLPYERAAARRVRKRQHGVRNIEQKA